jgi:hypothetical protein
MLTVKDAIEAGRKDGYPKATNGRYINSKDGNDYEIGTYGGELYNQPEKVESACFIGQMGINLRIDPNDLVIVLNEKCGYDFTDEVIRKNDKTSMTFDEIADFLESEYSDHLDYDIEPLLKERNAVR